MRMPTNNQPAGYPLFPFGSSYSFFSSFFPLHFPLPLPFLRLILHLLLLLLLGLDLLLPTRQFSLLLQLLDIDPLTLLEAVSGRGRLGALGARKRARRGGAELIERFEFGGGEGIFAFWAEGDGCAGSGCEKLEWEKREVG
jgi:hypothetical protein